MGGPISQIPTPVDLDEVLGRPTGQGYGAARKGPSVTGKPQPIVKEETKKGE
tara:strand:+ start:267 stop:422 length:156 start_codon:yes stop_codon:yes gene_type:complete